MFLTTSFFTNHYESGADKNYNQKKLVSMAQKLQPEAHKLVSQWESMKTDG